MGVLLGDGPEPAAVLGGADAEGLDERAAHGFRGAVAAGSGGLPDAFCAVFQVAAGGLQPGPLDVAAGWHAHLRGERAGEVARGQAGPFREGLHREVVRRVLGDPLLHVAQRHPAGDLGRELGAELSLVARAPEEHHEGAGHGERRVAAEVILHQREGQVDAGGDAGRGGDAPVLDVDRVRVDVDSRVLVPQGRAAGPVGGRARAVEQARLGQQKGAGADRGDPLRPRRVRAEPGDQVRVAAACSRAAGNDQQVGRLPEAGQIGQVAVRGDGQAARRADLAPAEAGGADPVPGVALVIGGDGEDLKRTGDVEGLHTVEQDHQYRSHASQSRGRGSWQQ